MGLKLSVDTNAYRSFLDGDAAFVDAIQQAEAIAFSVIVLGELRAGFMRGSRQEENERTLRKVLGLERVLVHEVTEETSMSYSEVWAYLRKRGRPIPTNDLWVAAQCLECGFALLSSDSHFRDIPKLQRFP